MGMTNLDSLTLSGSLITGTIQGLAVGGITAAGTDSQANSTALTATVNVVSTVGASTAGVRLPDAAAGLMVFVKNASATAMHIYPASGDAINALSANAAYDLAGAKSVLLVAVDATTWHTLLTA